MNDTEKYLFDLQGFLVVEGVLSKAEVAAANEAIDRHADGIALASIPFIVINLSRPHCLI